MDDESVKKIDMEILEEQIEQAPKSLATFIGVDEISHKKGHNYLTLIVDQKARRAIKLEEGRKAQSLERFFRYMGREDCRTIEAVCVDRWKPYRKAIRKWCPNAIICYDKFHIIQDCNDAVDRVRRRLISELPKDQRQELKHCKWAILKNPDNLTDPQREKLRRIERHNRPLFRAYLLKEQFRQFYAMRPDEHEPQERFLKRAADAFDQWCRSVMYSRLPELKHFVKNLRKDKERKLVLNYFIHRLTNGLTEGLNAIIRSIQRRAHGFRDMAYFSLKVYQKAGIIY